MTTAGKVPTAKVLVTGPTAVRKYQFLSFDKWQNISWNLYYSGNIGSWSLWRSTGILDGIKLWRAVPMAQAPDDGLASTAVRTCPCGVGPAITGEIFAPLASQPKPRRADVPPRAKVAPWRQYMASQSVPKDVAGKDPWEALLKYQEGKSYLGKETNILYTRIMALSSTKINLSIFCKLAEPPSPVGGARDMTQTVP